MFCVFGASYREGASTVSLGYAEAETTWLGEKKKKDETCFKVFNFILQKEASTCIMDSGEYYQLEF